MEFILAHLSTIFCYLSGILIAWSGFILFNFSVILRHARKSNRKFRKTDLVQVGIIGVAGVALSVALFVIPEYAAQVMDLLLVLNCWYLAFLISVTGTSTKSHLAITTTKKVESKLPTLKVVHSASKTKLI